MIVVALPALRVPTPIGVAPSKNVTVPVGVPATEPVTVAVKVTFWPKAEGFREEVMAVVEDAPSTVCVSTDEVLGSDVASPW
jgi:hypothetical protein